MISGEGFRVYQCPCENWQVEATEPSSGPVPIPRPRQSVENAAVDAIAWHTRWLDQESSLESALREHAKECSDMRQLLLDRGHGAPLLRLKLA